MREIRSSDYTEACYECDSLDLRIEWLTTHDDEDPNRIAVTCRDCGEEWEDYIGE